jgi:surface antigen
MAALDRAGVPMSGSTQSFWEDAKARGFVHSRKQPTVGDLVFFDNTYDRNRNGRWDDELTHIGIVLEVDRDGTITVAHGGTSKGRTTMVMNLSDPSARHSEDGRELNDWLRARRSNDPKRASYLSGELFRGFATLDDDRLASTP